MQICLPSASCVLCFLIAYTMLSISLSLSCREAIKLNLVLERDEEMNAVCSLLFCGAMTPHFVFGTERRIQTQMLLVAKLELCETSTQIKDADYSLLLELEFAISGMPAFNIK